MNKLLRDLFGLLSALLFPVSAWCQPTPTPSGPPPTPKPAYIQAIELEADIAERNYLMDKSMLNLSDFVSAYERMISASCFGDLRNTLSHEGYPADESCRSMIKKVLEVDGSSSIALCAQFGIDSPKCRQSWMLSKPGALSADSGAWTLFDKSKSGVIHTAKLQTVLIQKANAKKIGELAQQLAAKGSALKAKPKDRTLRAAYEKALFEAVKIGCNYNAVAVEPITANASESSSSENAAMMEYPASSSEGAGLDDDSTSELTDEADPFSSVLNSLKPTGPGRAATPTPIPLDGPQFMHYRLVPYECSKLIQNGMQLIPNSPVVVCFRDGGVAPSCIDARRKQPAIGKATPKKDTGAFSDF